MTTVTRKDLNAEQQAHAETRQKLAELQSRMSEMNVKQQVPVEKRVYVDRPDPKDKARIAELEAEVDRLKRELGART